MIITLTANPSLDRTVDLGAPLTPGGVHRIVADRTQVGGKGINVALGVHQADVDVLAVAPASDADPFTRLLHSTGVPARTSPVAGPVRTNLTVLSHPAVTTKINEPGAALTSQEVRAIEGLLLSSVQPGDRVMLSGSLAPGFAADAYAHLASSLHDRGAWVGVDTSDAPLSALSEHLPACAPDFLKPNAEELGQLIDADGTVLEAQAAKGDLTGLRDAARSLHERGIAEVLVTLGGSGAVLATADGTWFAPSAPVDVVSTVGAGDSATAGYLIGHALDEDAPTRLARAVAYGTAAVALPGTTIPRPDQVRVDVDSVRAL